MTKNASTKIPAARNAVSCMLAAALALGTVGLGTLSGCAGDASDTATEATEATGITTTEAADVTDDVTVTPEATVLDGAPQVEEGWPSVERPHEYGMSDGEAVYDAREYLGVDAENVETLDIARVWYEDRGCYDVSIKAKDAEAVQHVLVDAQSGEVLASWTE